MRSRRRLLEACAATGVAGLAGCLSGIRTTPTDAGTPDDGSTPATDERVAWRTGLDDAVTDPPALADGSVVAGTDAGTVAALDAADGGTRWTFGADDAVRGSPVVAGDVALAVSGGLGQGSPDTVHALDLAGGTERWSFAPGAWYLDVLGTHGDVAYVATADDALAASGQRLYALSLADGTERWSVEVGDNSGGVVTADTVYVPAVGVVDAVDTDGTRRWRYADGEYQYATLSVAGDTVAFVTGSSPEEWTVHGLDVATGEERWTFDEGVAYTTRAVGDRLLVGGRSVARLDPATGTTEWTADVGAPLYDAPVADGRLYVADEAAAALAVADGTVAWTTPLDAYLARPAGLVDGTLLVQRSESRDDRNRHVLGVDAATGERRWTFAGDAELTAPVVGGDRAFVAEGASLLALAP